MSFYFPIPKTEVKSKTTYDCNKCKLRTKVKTPIMEPIIGSDYNGIVILGQVPSKRDDENGRAFSDARSSILISQAKRFGINLINKAAWLFAASCYTHKPSETHFKCCRGILKERLQELQPKIIICCGEYAFKYLFDIKEKHAISKLRGRFIPNYEFNTIVFPVYDIYDFKIYKKSNRDQMDSYYESAIKIDLNNIFSAYKTRFNKRSKVDKFLLDRKILENISIKRIETYEDAEKVFKFVKQLDEVCLDYETTNLKPYDDNFSVVYAALSTDKEAWVFHESFWLTNPKRKKLFFKEMISILENNNILKIIQNGKFEDLCSRWLFGIKKINNIFCTMLATHVVDEKGGTKSQDFQNLTRFGIPPYNEKIKKFIVTDKKNDIEEEDDEGNVNINYQKQNRIREAPIDDLIQYNGLDVITCMNNSYVLRNYLLPEDKKNNKCLDFLTKGHEVFADMSQRGVPIHPQRLHEFKVLILGELARVEDEIKNLPSIIEYNKFLEQKRENETLEAKAEKELNALLKKGKKKKKGMVKLNRKLKL